jgi:hypothetical protein
MIDPFLDHDVQKAFRQWPTVRIFVGTKKSRWFMQCYVDFLLFFPDRPPVKQHFIFRAYLCPGCPHDVTVHHDTALCNKLLTFPA